MNVLICDPVADSAINKMKEAGLDVTVKTGMDKEELIKVIPDFDAMVVRSATKVRKDVIDVASNLKLIVRGGVGLDNIDVKYAQSKGIEVRNTPAASTRSVAELAIGYMFALARMIPQATISMKEGKWEKKRFKGTELMGKTLGLIGTGRIGSETARIAMAIGMSVIGYDPYIKEPPVSGMTLVSSMDEIFEKSDYISLHLPLTDETKHMINKEKLSKMKKSAFLVNCARGGIIEENDLYEALKEGIIAGAALDVYEEEPPTDRKLFELDNFLCSPHVGASTKEGQGRVGDEVADIIIDFSK